MIATESEARGWVEALPECDAAAIARLDRLVECLIDENARQNLVAASSLETVWQRHIADSAQLLAEVPRGTSPWLDLGTGAGFPGLVIAALRPECEVLLVESRKRRVEWLDRMVSELRLGAVQVIGAQLEAVPTRAVSVISARAFAPLNRLLAISSRFSTSHTIWLLPKGRSAQHELDVLRDWDHSFHVKQSLTDPASGVVVGRISAAARKD